MTVDMRAVCPREPIENLGAVAQLERYWPAPTLVWRIHGHVDAAAARWFAARTFG